MDDITPAYFRTDGGGAALRILRDALVGAGYPIQLTLDIVGEASKEDLTLTDWERPSSAGRSRSCTRSVW